MDLTTIYLSICKEHSHKLAHYFSHKKTLYEDDFSLEQGSLSLALCCSSLVVCCECLLMVLFIGEASQSCLTCMKTFVICLLCKTPSVPCNACTTPNVSHALHHVLLIHYTMCTPCILLLVTTCNLPSCQMYVEHVAMAGPHNL